MALNHKRIANTKEGVKEVLQTMNQLVDRYVDHLVQSQPDRFEDIPGDHADSMVSPFPIIGLLNREVEHKFQEFLVDLNGERLENKTSTEGTVLPLTPKKKTETEH